MASTAELQALEVALRSVGSPRASQPPQPADPADVMDQLAQIDLVAPPGLLDWYGWRNGDGGPGSIVLHDPNIEQPETPDSRIVSSVSELAALYVSTIEQEWVDVDPTSPHFLDFVVERVPESAWDPVLSL